jgi:hypothetical protein
MGERCPAAILFGVVLCTRCHYNAGHGGQHQGPGLEGFAYQRIGWLDGDRRQFMSERTDEHAWKIDPLELHEWPPAPLST